MIEIDFSTNIYLGDEKLTQFHMLCLVTEEKLLNVCYVIFK